MILTQADLDDFELHSRVLEDSDGEEDMGQFHAWVANNPQVLMAAMFQEFVGAHELPLYKKISPFLIPGPRPAFRTYEGQWLLMSLGPRNWEGLSLEGLRRAFSEDPKFGHRFDELIDESAVPIPMASEIIEKASRFVSSPLVDSTLFVSPRLWTPFAQGIEKETLATSAASIIRAIQDERVELNSLRWNQLEDIVAEILRAQGVEIHVVRERPQGGRDIIARAELVPGKEVLTIAVEVKHKKVVSRPDVQKALYQNRAFPALMFVTSGRFSAGVIREAQRAENRMQLILKDGLAIRELIGSYKLNA